MIREEVWKLLEEIEDKYEEGVPDPEDYETDCKNCGEEVIYVLREDEEEFVCPNCGQKASMLSLNSEEIQKWKEMKDG